jgi:hypothetical protein
VVRDRPRVRVCRSHRFEICHHRGTHGWATSWWIPPLILIRYSSVLMELLPCQPRPSPLDPHPIPLLRDQFVFFHYFGLPTETFHDLPPHASSPHGNVGCTSTMTIFVTDLARRVVNEGVLPADPLPEGAHLETRSKRQFDEICPEIFTRGR